MKTTTYTTYAAGNFEITVVSGQFNHITISKNMPLIQRASLGKDFKTFDEAAKAYKSAEIKSALLQIELGLMNPSRVYIHN